MPVKPFLYLCYLLVGWCQGEPIICPWYLYRLLCSSLVGRSHKRSNAVIRGDAEPLTGHMVQDVSFQGQGRLRCGPPEVRPSMAA